MVKIVSWNVNSVGVRLPHLEMLIKQEAPDVILLQEIKCIDERFVTAELETYGYNCIVFGQKSYNGVAILTKGSVEDVTRGLINQPSYMEEESRYLECVTNISGLVLRVASLYIPNGQAVGSIKFEHKMFFFDLLRAHMGERLNFSEAYVVGGDYNVAPQHLDVYDPIALDGTLGFHPKEREHFQRILDSGFYEHLGNSIHLSKPFHGGTIEPWDLNEIGMRIDQILGSKEAMNIAKEAGVYEFYRTLERPSDHAPIYLVL